MQTVICFYNQMSTEEKTIKNIYLRRKIILRLKMFKSTKLLKEQLHLKLKKLKVVKIINVYPDHTIVKFNLDSFENKGGSCQNLTIINCSKPNSFNNQVV